MADPIESGSLGLKLSSVLDYSEKHLRPAQHELSCPAVWRRELRIERTGIPGGSGQAIGAGRSVCCCLAVMPALASAAFRQAGLRAQEQRWRQRFQREDAQQD